MALGLLYVMSLILSESNNPLPEIILGAYTTLTLASFPAM